MSETLVCLLEEPSAREMLKGILPEVLGSENEVKYIVFEGKQDLEKNIERKLKYWNVPQSSFLVMRDQDSGDCKRIKDLLLEKVQRSGKASKTLVRTACKELESFYLGDLQAVEAGMQINGLSRQQENRKFRTPDQLASPSKELDTLTTGMYQKIDGSRKIAPHLKLDGSNRSISFKNLISGIQKLVS
ncbi:MAG: hypothetical protein F6K07_32915 [Okeania sp. SIO1H5]|uniref:DUF4276 family protein n=1 Tax=Okeania sp. SIO1H5 TaxID=2607777 RepID=UPI0013BCA718|nr:DUF4276 family protein [Okeania sp. SIO1H5]NET23796.1 hypothetical protein [Okeania sp. SIO1H5]